jgi:hypothetical protein
VNGDSYSRAASTTPSSARLSMIRFTNSIWFLLS